MTCDLWKRLVERSTSCTECELHASATNRVISDPDWCGERPVAFIGEGPGEQEDLNGRPFIGRSGQYLRSKMDEYGIDEDDRYILNIVQCRPPGNRKPLAHEIRRCKTFLFEKLWLFRPNIVITLGETAAKGMLGVNMVTMSTKTGTWEMVTLEGSEGRKIDVPVYFLRHPAWAIRGNQPEYDEDWKKLRRWLDDQGAIGRS